MKFRSAKTIKNDFLRSRTKQSDADFLQACAVPTDSAARALQIRRAIANLAKVEPEDVHALDTFNDDLAHFDFWGSLDSIAVLIELEQCLGLQISDSAAAEIPNPERKPGLTAADFVRSTLRVIEGR